MIVALRFYLLLLLVAAIALLISSLFALKNGLVFLWVFDLILIILALWDYQKGKNHRVQVRRHPIHKLSIGRDNPIVLSVGSNNIKKKVIIQDYYPLEFTASPERFQLTLEGKKNQDLIYTVSPKNRGEFEWGEIQIRQLSPWGLVWDDWKIKASQKAEVYPDLLGLRSLSVRLAIENTGTMRQARRLGQGTEFAELREYRTGDDSRLIDWKATARRSRPVVRVLEPEREQTVIILLDRGRLMTAQVQGIKRFDWGLNSTLSLALAALHRADRVGIGVFDKQIATWLPPERGQHQLSHILERLTPIQPVLLEPDYVGAVTRLVTQQTRRALVVIITDIIDATASSELLSALARLSPRYLPFCVTLRDPQMDEIAHTSTPEIQAAYNRAVALDLLSQRQLAFTQLKQKGVFVLDALANKVSEQLVEQYLQLKAKNLI
jgi:uncharacterized protein (DUF58 family)